MTSDQPGEPGEAAPPDRHDQPLPSFPTSLGTSGGTTITLPGEDLARNTFHPSRTDLMRREPRCGAETGRMCPDCGFHLIASA